MILRFKKNEAIIKKGSLVGVEAHRERNKESQRIRLRRLWSRRRCPRRTWMI
jgi:hypothetical protein